MATGTIDTTPVDTSILMERYKLSSRQTLGDRMKFLGIKVFRIPPDKRKTYVQAYQMELLDELDNHLKVRGAKMSEFVPSKSSSRQIEPVEESEVVKIESLDSHQALNVLAGIIDKLIFSESEKSPLEPYRELEETYRNKWVLSTSTVTKLIGKRPKGDRYSWGGFVLLKSGKVGRQDGWSVVKRYTGVED